MELARPEMISQIDRFVINDLGIPEAELVRRSGAAVAAEVERCVPYGGSICIFAGGGNNGADKENAIAHTGKIPFVAHGGAVITGNIA